MQQSLKADPYDLCVYCDNVVLFFFQLCLDTTKHSRNLLLCEHDENYQAAKFQGEMPVTCKTMSKTPWHLLIADSM